MERRSVWFLLPRQLRELPADLTAVVVVSLLTNVAVFVPGLRETPLRVLLGLPFVLFVPGYAFIAALFPEAGDSPTSDTDGTDEQVNNDVTATHGLSANHRGIDGIERIALSFGLSIAIVPLIGLVLNFTPWGIRLPPIMVAVTAFTLCASAVAAQRRWALPPEERFTVPYQRWLRGAYTELTQPDSRADFALNILLMMSVLLAVGSVGYAITVPQQGESFTEFYLLTETDEGELVADDYPTEFVAGEPQSVVVGVGNQEYERETYTVVVEIQRVAVVDNETVVQEATEIDRFRTTVEHNETWHHTHTVAPSMTGDRLRLQYLLYRDAPSTPLNRSAAYRDLHLWVNVSAPE